jgi:DNA-binding transcriptional MocR family regulator
VRGNLKKPEVGFHYGQKFACKGNLKNYLRISFTYYPEEKLRLAVQILSEEIKAYKNELEKVKK